jgi:hypothetical protein
MHYFTYTGSKVTGFRRALKGESEGTCTKEQRKWGLHLSYYTVVDGVLTPLSPEDKTTLDAAEISKKLEKSNRVADIEDAKLVSELKSATIGQAESFIDGQLDGATTVAALREATKAVLKKMMPYVLE